MSNVDVNLVDLERSGVLSVSLDDGVRVLVDGEEVVRVTCNVDDTEAVALSMLDIDLG